MMEKRHSVRISGKCQQNVFFHYSFFKLFSLGLGKIEKSQANSKMAFLEAQIEKKRKEREEKGLNDDVRPPPLCN